MNYSSKDNGNSEVRVRAQVMMRDDSTGGWVPMGGGGLSNVSVRKRKIHHDEYDQPCRHEYLIHGKRISDNSVVLSCTIKKDFEYNKVMPTFHHWKTGNKKFGLTFQTAADARAFDKGVRAAIQDLLDGITETSPLHQYNLDVGDDDVFMQLDLPVDKGCEPRSPVGSCRTPSPLGALDPTAPVDSKSNSPPLGGQGTMSLPTPVPTPVSAALVCTVSDPTHSHLHFPPRTRYIVEQPTSGREKSRILLSEKIDNLGSHSVGTGLNQDKDSPYVKFPWREPPHEYSYPKLVDTFADDGKPSARSSLKRTHLPIKKSNSGGSDPAKGSLILVGSGSSFGSTSNYDSSISGSGDGKGRGSQPPPAGNSSSSKLLLPTLDTKPSLTCTGSPPKAAGGPATMTLTCAHCRESFSMDNNRIGACAYAPADGVRRGIEAVTCLQCAKCLLYHCMSDAEGDYVHPCECTNSDGHWARRWIGLSLLSILVPCLCCYVPLMACYRCGIACNVCGGRHEAS